VATVIVSLSPPPHSLAIPAVCPESATEAVRVRPSPCARRPRSFRAHPSPVVGGTSSTFTVTALDPNNNVATTYMDRVTLSGTDPAASLPVSGC